MGIIIDMKNQMIINLNYLQQTTKVINCSKKTNKKMFAKTMSKNIHIQTQNNKINSKPSRKKSLRDLLLFYKQKFNNNVEIEKTSYKTKTINYGGTSEQTCN